MPHISSRLGPAVSLSIAAIAMLTVSGCHAGGPTASTAPTAAPTSAAAVVATSTATTTATTTSQPSPAAETASPAAPSGNAGVCSLITQAEARTAVGRDPGPGHVVSPGHCIYGTGAASINVVVQTGGKAEFDGLRAAMGARAVDVTGVGDGAFGVFAGDFATIEFYKGDALVALNLVLGGTTVPPKDQAIALAKIAAPRC